MKHIFLSTVIALLIPATLLWAGGGQEESTEETPTEQSGASSGTDREDGSDAGDRIAVEEAVATVNGESISRTEFEQVMASNIARWEAQNQQEFNAEFRPQLERQVLNGLITRTILEQEAESIGVSVGDDDVDAMLTQFKGQFPNESAYLMSLEQEGFTEDEFILELRRQMTIEELIRTEVYDNVTVDEEAMRTFYENNPQYFEQGEQVAARHIILSTEGISDETELAAKREELEEIRQEIVDGADFAEVAQERSEGPSASNGGNLGQFGRGQMVPAFEEAAFNLEPGELSQIVETQFGFHILQVTEKIPAQTESYENAKENIRTFLTEQERNVAVQRYLADLRNESEIEELIEINIPVPMPN